MTSPLRYLATMFGWSIKSILATFLALSLLLNMAIMTISGVQAVISGAFSAVGISTVAAREAAEKLSGNASRKASLRAALKAERKAASEAAERVAHKKATRKILREISSRVTTRAQRSAVRNSASVFGESIPFLGVAVIVGALALEIKDSCDTARDISMLAAAVEADSNPQTAMAKAEEGFDCRKLIGDAIEVPTTDEIWVMIRQSPSTAWNRAQAFYDDLPDVSFSGSFEWLVKVGQDLLAFADLMDEVAQ